MGTSIVMVARELLKVQLQAFTKLLSPSFCLLTVVILGITPQNSLSWSEKVFFFFIIRYLHFHFFFPNKEPFVKVILQVLPTIVVLFELTECCL